jgi:hypothetical protein
MNIIDRYNVWDNKLQREYKCLWPNMKCFNWDGVISPEDYYKANVKVMFLNREAYGDDYNINEVLKEQIDNNLVVFQNKPIKNKLKNRLKTLSLLEKKVLSITDEDFEQCLDLYSEEDFRKDLLKVAYCNIKKSDGEPKSRIKNLRECLIINKDIIEKQILFFNPSVIVGGNVFDGIIERVMDDFGMDLYNKPGTINVYTLKIHEKEFPFIDMSHPSSLKNVLIDALELFTAIKEVETSNPGYWRSRCGLSCFE